MYMCRRERKKNRLRKWILFYPLFVSFLFLLRLHFVLITLLKPFSFDARLNLFTVFFRLFLYFIYFFSYFYFHYYYYLTHVLRVSKKKGKRKGIKASLCMCVCVHTLIKRFLRVLTWDSFKIKKIL